MQELPKPWFDLDGYRRTRLLEARYEAELARRFLDEGLTRNAAGKAYQAWKALVAAFAAENRDKLKDVFKGVVRLRGNRVINKVDWIIALMPSNALKRVSQVIGGDINVYTNLAIMLHQYQYNGPDKQGILSQYWDDESAKADIVQLLSVIDRLLREKGI
ncbi:PaREP1 family protein [Vulcanisaeta distributa]|uniref:PaREP1 family protein n=1 Tax=Vulcanisaeta distributa (strain DSM 14429 / JCM 11212 / NBRC 100878 / IC-017) TaxID=572478 RepID=E1QSV4_VULDI|nr:PaREP1 family protein [Vulcanisaeta distributa]ADN50821.1 PaREP1 family protein [Vulcanisaeta distributa DSM 14429]